MIIMLAESRDGGKALITLYKEKENARSPSCVCLHSGHQNQTFLSIDKTFCDLCNHLLQYIYYILTCSSDAILMSEPNLKLFNANFLSI